MTEGTSSGAKASIVELAADPRLRRIERDHALLGAALVVAQLFLGGAHAAASLGLGWVVVATGLWVWKRVALLLFSGDAGTNRALGLRVVGKAVVSLAALILLLPRIEIQILPMLLGGAVLPAVLLIEALRIGLEPSASTSPHGPAA